jgi:hypothetical protein
MLTADFCKFARGISGLEKVLKVSNKCIFVRPFIGHLCRKALKGYIDPILYWY